MEFDPLERLDPKRHDAMEILDAANAFAELTDTEQDEHLGPWDYAGLNDAQHPLVALVPEAHNATCIVPDLDGSLLFLWQESPSFERWFVGPLYREHLMGIDEVEELLDDDPEWLVERGIPVSSDELAAGVCGLPGAPGPVTRF